MCNSFVIGQDTTSKAPKIIKKKKKEKHGTLLKYASVDQCSFKELKWKLKNVM